MSIYDESAGVLRQRPASQIVYRSIGFELAAFEILIIFGTTILSQALYTKYFWGRVGDLESAVGIGIVVASLYVATARAKGLYSYSSILWNGATIRQIAAIWTFAFLTAAMAAFLFKAGDQFSRGSTITLFFVGFAGVAALRQLASSALHSGIRFGSLRARRALVFFDPRIGTNSIVSALKQHGYHVVGCLPIPQSVLSPNPRDSNADSRDIATEVSDKVAALTRSERLDEAFIVAPISKSSQFRQLAYYFRGLSLPLQFVPAPEMALLLDRPIVDYGSLKAFELVRPPLSRMERVVKRAMDIALASVALLGIWPLLAMVAILIKLDSPGPVIFAQKRVGENGKIFRIFKFRSMRVMDDGDVVKQACRNDDRVTLIGRWLRSTSIDELPQLFNILKGDMSVVGPRPHAVAHDNKYRTVVPDYTMRHRMKPGLTGLAQVTGYRGETSTCDLMAKRVEFDLWYISNWSLWLDLTIIVRTVFALRHTSKVY
jgi:putative colanic acid biosynthesis UDP-glucose lipid carrier transferase